MKAIVKFCLALVGLWIMAAQPAAATATCGAFEQIVEGLLERYQEVPRHTGQGDGYRVIVFADANGETWTIIGLRPDGVACQIASGTDWATAAPAAPEANL